MIILFVTLLFVIPIFFIFKIDSIGDKAEIKARDEQFKIEIQKINKEFTGRKVI